jgi:hypothetical protein
MTHSLQIARSPRQTERLGAPRQDETDAANNPLARFEQGSHNAFVAPATSELTNHCARCANADTALCGPCVTEANWRGGGLQHFRPVSVLAEVELEREARAA